MFHSVKMKSCLKMTFLYTMLLLKPVFLEDLQCSQYENSYTKLSYRLWWKDTKKREGLEVLSGGNSGC